MCGHQGGPRWAPRRSGKPRVSRECSGLANLSSFLPACSRRPCSSILLSILFLPKATHRSFVFFFTRKPIGVTRPVSGAWTANTRPADASSLRSCGRTEFSHASTPRLDPAPPLRAPVRGPPALSPGLRASRGGHQHGPGPRGPWRNRYFLPSKAQWGFPVGLLLLFLAPLLGRITATVADHTSLSAGVRREEAGPGTGQGGPALPGSVLSACISGALRGQRCEVCISHRRSLRPATTADTGL